MQKKKVFTLAVAGMVLLTMQAVPVSAASLEPSSPKPIALNRIITPQWVDTTLVVPSISKSKRSISVSLLISPKKSTVKSSGTLYLEQYSGGRWKEVKSWSVNASGTVDITKSYTGKSNVKYRTNVVVTTGSDKITATSSEITF